MSHTEKIVEEYEYTVEICDACGHHISQHYNTPKDVFYLDGRYMYTAEGCMALYGTRKLKGDNPYLRCECLHSR